MHGGSNILLILHDQIMKEIQAQPYNSDLWHAVWGLRAEMDDNIFAALGFYEKSSHFVAGIRHHTLTHFPTVPYNQTSKPAPLPSPEFMPGTIHTGPNYFVASVQHNQLNNASSPGATPAQELTPVRETVTTKRKNPPCRLTEVDISILQALNRTQVTKDNFQQIKVATFLQLSVDTVRKSSRKLRELNYISRWPELTDEALTFLRTQAPVASEKINWDFERHHQGAPIVPQHELQKTREKQARTEVVQNVPQMPRKNMLDIKNILN